MTEIAFINFEKQRYFLEKKEICDYIASYLIKKNKCNSSFSAYQNAESVLKAIEVQHGILIERARCIYSFELTFQEYFTAQALTSSFYLEKPDSCLDHVTNKSWREVFLIASGSMKEPETLLIAMNTKIKDNIADCNKVHSFLRWIERKSSSSDSLHPAAIRAFYMIFELTFIDVLRKEYSESSFVK